MHAITAGTFDYATTFPDSPRAKLFARQAGDVQNIETYLEAWVKRQEKHLKASTFNGYRKIVDHQLIPWFGAMMLSDLKRKDVRAKLDEVEAGNKTLANIQSVLRKALDDAIEAEYIEVNPLAGWRYVKKEAPKEVDDVDPFTVDEQKLILDHLTGQGRNLIQFAFWTGLRTSELVALDWGDIDWNRGEVRISRAMTQAADKAEVTKTTSGKRDIKLLRAAREALEAQKAFTYLKGEEVFQNPRSLERWNGDQPIRKTLWAHALKKAGVRYRRPYQTRHTFASMMLSAGEHPMWVAKQMGHADWTMIARVYGRWMPDADVGAGSKAELLFGISEQPEPIIDAKLYG
jgi:integrase